MKKRLFTFTLLMGFLLTACGAPAGETPVATAEQATQGEPAAPQTDEAGWQLEENAVLLPISQADYVVGEGVTPQNEKGETYFDEDVGLLTAISPDATVTYTVPEGVDGSYDIYLRMSKSLAAFCSTPFTISINEGPEIAVPVEIQISADSPAATDASTGVWSDSGRFCYGRNADLKAGDTITIRAAHGSRAASVKGQAFPSLGSITLIPAGELVAVGFDNKMEEPLAQADPSDPLSGLKIVWLGSSVTFGAHSTNNYTMGDAIQDRHAGTQCLKYAMSSTTLVNANENSYVARLKEVDPNCQPNLLIVQLSTNDATTGKPLGEMTDSFNPATFDDQTIVGAIETIIDYGRNTLGCDVLFYTGTWYEDEAYAQMVDVLMQIQQKWGIGIIDLYHNEEMTALYGTDQYNAYMFDEIHPNYDGYVEWWTPAFEQSLTEYLANNADN